MCRWWSAASSRPRMPRSSSPRRRRVFTPKDYDPGAVMAEIVGLLEQRVAPPERLRRRGGADAVTGRRSDRRRFAAAARGLPGGQRLAIDPGEDVLPDHAPLQVAQQQMPAVGIDHLDAGVARRRSIIALWAPGGTISSCSPTITRSGPGITSAAAYAVSINWTRPAMASTRVSLMNRGSAEAARSASMLSDAMTPEAAAGELQARRQARPPTAWRDRTG